jgi:hypothetical protein
MLVTRVGQSRTSLSTTGWSGPCPTTTTSRAGARLRGDEAPGVGKQSRVLGALEHAYPGDRRLLWKRLGHLSR